MSRKQSIRISEQERLTSLFRLASRSVKAPKNLSIRSATAVGPKPKRCAIRFARRSTKRPPDAYISYIVRPGPPVHGCTCPVGLASTARGPGETTKGNRTEELVVEVIWTGGAFRGQMFPCRVCHTYIWHCTASMAVADISQGASPVAGNVFPYRHVGCGGYGSARCGCHGRQK